MHATFRYWIPYNHNNFRVWSLNLSYKKKYIVWKKHNSWTHTTDLESLIIRNFHQPTNNVKFYIFTQTLGESQKYFTILKICCFPINVFSGSNDTFFILPCFYVNNLFPFQPGMIKQHYHKHIRKSVI